MKELSLWEEFSIANFQKVFIQAVVAESNRLLVLSQLKRVLGLGLRRGTSSFFDEESQDAVVLPVDPTHMASVSRGPRHTGRSKGSGGRGTKKKEEPKSSQAVETETSQKDVLAEIYENRSPPQANIHRLSNAILNENDTRSLSASPGRKRRRCSIRYQRTRLRLTIQRTQGGSRGQLVVM